MTETIGWIALLGLGIGAAWIYMFSTKLEQNMRDNPLREISDVGLRVEKSK